ncbi:vascular endothelial growth factor A isoform X1 [Frieseomelitta varia]|uniref:vascular endothelial growth factor A isoform X1 n=1 Tax=Frieseomelitta varia TaxID=561572 RepID=UPI001CB6B2E2|nr:vascular endothelial growth factor A isoform X1 [Frieseomelitta varia]
MSRLVTCRTLVLVIFCGLVTSQKDDIVFPDQISPRALSPPVEPAAAHNAALLRSRSSQIVKKINSVDEFLRMIGVSPSEVFSLSSRMGESEERKNSKMAEQAVCKPSLKVVPTYEPNDPSIFFFPRCTRVNRCGGCCGNQLLSCEAKKTETQNFEIVVAKFMGDRFEYQGKQVVPIDVDTKCECNCIIKPSDCTPKQIYKPAECKCTCTNQDERQKCNEHEEKTWDSINCSCSCRNPHECSTGWFYDQNTCRCEQLPLSRSWFSSVTRETGYRFGQTQRPENAPPVIIALSDADDPRRKPKPDPEYK